MIKNTKKRTKYHKAHKATRVMATTVVLGNTILTPVNVLAIANPGVQEQDSLTMMDIRLLSRMMY